MADDPDHRFRRLPRATTSDLFEHFGVNVDPKPAPPRAEVIAALPCDNCGWLRAVADRSSCLVCGYLSRHQR